MSIKMEELVAFAKQQGFVYQGSEIYNGLANTWDYGPLGVEIKNNIKKLWWKEFVNKEANNIGLDSSILMNNLVWKASGHVDGFSDPLIDCKKCGSRFRADKIIEESCDVIVDGWDNDKITKFIIDNNIVCQNCNNLDYTDIRSFNLMFKTNMGVIINESNEVYLRPETAQGIFINFKNIARTSRKKIPFGVGQIGKAFRNEITPGNFIFRTREFEQMELEYFVKPGTELEWFSYYQDKIIGFLDLININKDNYRIREHNSDELSHYSNKTSDIEYKFPFGFGELWGLASRTDFDLNAHQNASKQDMTYLDPETNERYIPYVLEPSVGVDRLFLAILSDAYVKEDLEDGTTRELLKISYKLAPIQVCVLPLVKKLDSNARKIFNELSEDFIVDYDLSGNIGKRYRRQDAIGTPVCITFDYDSLEDNCVTVRDRDTMEQTRVNISELSQYVSNKFRG